VALTDLARLASPFDAVDFAFNAVARDSPAFACIYSLSAAVSRDRLAALQQPPDEL
jgi:hypothetical protein